MAKISVVGAGIGGMSAAARLAKQGHQVTVFENSDQSGGKCRTEWFGDYAFDTGPSLLTLPAVFRDLFLKTGKRIGYIPQFIQSKNIPRNRKILRYLSQSKLASNY